MSCRGLSPNTNPLACLTCESSNTILADSLAPILGIVPVVQLICWLANEFIYCISLTLTHPNECLSIEFGLGTLAIISLLGLLVMIRLSPYFLNSSAIASAIINLSSSITVNADAFLDTISSSPCLVTLK